MAVYKDFHDTKSDVILEDSDAIKEAIKNILSIRSPTLFGNPGFGANLEQFIFEQMDFVTRHQIQELVASSLYNNESRITNIEVNVLEQPEYNRVYIEVNFLIKAINTTEQVTIKLR